MHKLTLLSLIGFLTFFCNCKKETIVQTVIQKDTVYVQVHDTTTIPALVSDTTTTFIIMRHAEKEATGTDPNLNSDGLLRANELKRILGNTPVHAIYTTPYNRTRQTVQPLATAKGLTVVEYPVSKPYAQLVDEIRAAHRGKVVVITGHSNTVPEILKQVSNNAFNVTIAESQYDNLFIVTLPNGLSTTVTHLKYGKETP
ncbi:MAG: phosphoglycerate mutase family protein [Bacteroidota bacterium]